MIIAQIKTIRLTHKASYQLSNAAYNRAREWLSHWTPQAQFMAVMAPDRVEALKMLREDLAGSLVPGWLMHESGVKLEHFEFEISEQEVQENRFWMPSGTVLCKWFRVVEGNHG